MKYIESITDEAVGDLEMLFGQILIYELDEAGHSVSRQTISVDITPPNA
jgi:bisphosphoglycerate-dependent phosphoglycerate mutase